MMKSLKTVLLAGFACLALTGTAAAQSVTVYSAGPGSLMEKLAAGFQDETGIDVNVFQATTGKVMARLEAESSNPMADVVISASWKTATSFAKKDMLLDYTSANAKTVPDFLQGPGYVAQGISALAIAWNPKSGTPKPADWTDLTKPAYKDLITMPDPARSGSAFELVAALTAKKDLGWKLFEDLAANKMIVPGANAQALNPVLQGAKAVVFGAVDYIGLSRAAKGESIEVIFPKSGTVIAPRPMMILKTSAHQAEAKKFIDYVLSDAGQAMVANTKLMPARSDVKADRPLIADLKILKVDPKIDRKAVLDRFAKTFGME